jgi:hypothetical protein
MNSLEIPYSKRKLNPVTMTPDSDRRISAMLLTWSPGNKPVAIPVNTPRMQKKITRKRGSKKILLRPEE